MKTHRLAEIFGMIGVVLSLIFVGVEVNQNTNLSRNQAYLDFSESLKDLTLQIATDDVLPSLIARTVAGETRIDFSIEDQVRLNSMQIATVRVWEGLFRSWQSGLLPEETIINTNIGGGILLNNDYFREFWKEVKLQHTVDFVLFFEQQPWNVRM
ncbi:MAG: hypothetical protein CMQ45_01230 [Gammaproteobacteria bacterium]|nr:hypothetical protein [Gammaproteobacteria bacterium]|tara:strand:+ start:97 stop:561 length:465 start_codon:yes stop_codon:yes gene_type:complete